MFCAEGFVWNNKLLYINIRPTKGFLGASCQAVHEAEDQWAPWGQFYLLPLWGPRSLPGLKRGCLVRPTQYRVPGSFLLRLGEPSLVRLQKTGPGRWRGSDEGSSWIGAVVQGHRLRGRAEGCDCPWWLGEIRVLSVPEEQRTRDPWLRKLAVVPSAYMMTPPGCDEVKLSEGQLWGAQASQSSPKPDWCGDPCSTETLGKGRGVPP